MAILVVAGLTVPIAGPDGIKKLIREIGGNRATMFSGLTRSTVRAIKRTWIVTTRLLILSELNTLESTIAPSAIGSGATCSGDALGSVTVTCFVQYQGADPQWTKGQVRFRAMFTLIEQ